MEFKDGYTVTEVARIAGVTVKTLHHYHKIGLLKPCKVTEAGYRLYGTKELERLQAILFYRELDFSLEQIGKALADERGRTEVLTEQYRLLLARRERMDRLLQTLEESIRLAKNGEENVDKAAMFQGLDVDLPFLGPKSQGKVRDIYQRGDQLVLVTTDRLSAFDRILGLVPYKGQVLNQLAAFWFGETSDIVANHLIETPDPNVTVARACMPLPVEVVVRGYISGVTSTALWYRYSQGERNIYGIDFPDGLHKNDALPTPIITPTTKARDGGHDERITPAEIVASGLVEAKLWEEVSEAAIAVFKRGQEIAQRGGLILVDTKYEFGVDGNGQLTLIDEVHTPDSSRFWRADSYATRHNAGEEPENFDKEFIRLYYAAKGYRGEGDPFPMPPDLAVQAAERYITSYEMITGDAFVPGEYPAAPRIEKAMRHWDEQ